MDIRQLFAKSEALYISIVKDISKMAYAVADIMKKKGRAFDPELTVEKFDLVLQYSLLQIACSDSDLAKEEIAFIKDLTKYADFCDFISSVNEKYADLTWDKLLSYKAEKVSSILYETENDLRAVSEEVVSVFAIGDRADRYNHLADLSDNVFGIISGLAFADGDEDSEDLRQNVLIYDCIDKIEELK